MKQKKFLKEIKKLEKDRKNLLEKLKNHPVILSKTNFFTTKDKKNFLELWKEFIVFFTKIQKLIKKSKYRKFFIIVDYEKLLIRKYLLIFYFNTLILILKNFGTHETFLRKFLEENFRKDYGTFAKYIYKPKFINLINTPNIFIYAFKSKINKKLYFMFDAKILEYNSRVLTDYKNFYFYFKTRFEKILLFLSKNIGGLIAKTRFTSREKGLITQKNLKKYLEIAKPGDIFLTRGNWNASNISIPGFWKHMALYLGTGEYLKKNYNFKFLKNLEDKKHYIVEATGEGVLVKQIEKLLEKVDYLGVSRTSFGEEKIKRSIKKSLENVGKGYDHLFNYYSDKSLVCSELVIKSYSKDFEKDDEISVKLEHIGVSLTYPPNNFVKKIILEENKKNPEVFFVFFIDSIEKTHKNFISDKKNFYESYNRPKLSIFLK